MVDVPKLKTAQRPVAELVPYARNARKHSAQQIDSLAASIGRFGFNVPVCVDANGGIVAGHGRVLAAKRLGMQTLPVVLVDHLSEKDKRAFIIADNKIADMADWDTVILADEMTDLAALGVDFDDFFSQKELEKLLPDLPSLDATEPTTQPKAVQDTTEQQYAVMVLCPSEAEQEAAFNELAAAGWHCKVVTV